MYRSSKYCTCHPLELLELINFGGRPAHLGRFFWVIVYNSKTWLLKDWNKFTNINIMVLCWRYDILISLVTESYNYFYYSSKVRNCTNTQECRIKETYIDVHYTKNQFSIIIFVEPGCVTKSDDNLLFWLLEGFKNRAWLFPLFSLPCWNEESKTRKKTRLLREDPVETIINGIFRKTNNSCY